MVVNRIKESQTAAESVRPGEGRRGSRAGAHRGDRSQMDCPEVTFIISTLVHLVIYSILFQSSLFVCVFNILVFEFSCSNNLFL